MLRHSVIRVRNLKPRLHCINYDFRAIVLSETSKNLAYMMAYQPERKRRNPIMPFEKGGDDCSCFGCWEV